MSINHKDVCKILNGIYEKKNHDYGNSFTETYNKLGLVSCITRIYDKCNRLTNLCVNDNLVESESMNDTLLDLANYAIMTYMEIVNNDFNSQLDNVKNVVKNVVKNDRDLTLKELKELKWNEVVEMFSKVKYYDGSEILQMTATNDNKIKDITTLKHGLVIIHE